MELVGLYGDMSDTYPSTYWWRRRIYLIFILFSPLAPLASHRVRWMDRQGRREAAALRARAPRALPACLVIMS